MSLFVSGTEVKTAMNIQNIAFLKDQEAPLMKLLKDQEYRYDITLPPGLKYAQVTGASELTLSRTLVKTGVKESVKKPLSELKAEIVKYSVDVDKRAFQKTKGDTGSEAFEAAKIHNKDTFASVNGVNYYFQGAYMSGDQFAVGGALAKETTARLILVYQNDEEAAAKRMVAFYVGSCKLTANRLLLLLVADSKKAYFQIDKWAHKNNWTVKGDLKFLSPIPRTRRFTVGGATTAMAATVLDTTKSGVRAAWQNVNPNENAYWAMRIDQFLERRGVHRAKHYVIVWIRFSGKAGGAHAELDDSWTGLGQVVHELLKNNEINIVVVGKPRGNKDIREKIRKHSPGDADNARLSVWGEYWKMESRELVDGADDVMGTNRAAEYGIFLRMMDKSWGCKLVHLGMRSGAMDAAALLGMKTLFIENAANKQIARTTKWSGRDNDNPLYQRVPVAQMPTWTARTMIHDYAAVPKTDTTAAYKPEQLTDGTEALKQFQDLKAVMRGYLESDLTLIVTAVTNALK